MSNETAAVLTKASGSVYVERNGTRLALAEGDAIRPTDTVLTDSTSTAEIRFEDGSTATLSPSSTLAVSEFAFGGGQEPSFVLNLAQGAMRSVSGGVVKQNPEAFKIVTPKATVGIRGTELFNSVQGDQEVHAVLLIGKGHVVVVTGNDGASITLNAALQGVTFNNQGVMTRQVYTLQELENLIRDLAPTQLNVPLPTGEDGAQADGTDQQAANSPLTVLVVYEAPTVETVLSSMDTNAGHADTLISSVENLAGTLVDAGFSVETLEMNGTGSLLAALNQILYASSTVDANEGGILPGSPAPVVPPTSPVTPPTPDPTPDPPSPPSPWDIVFEGDLPAGWGLGHLVGLSPEAPIIMQVKGNVNEDVPLNSQNPTSGVLANDHVDVVGGLRSAALMGDAETLGTLSRLPSADIQTGNDTLSVGVVDASSAIYGDAREILGSGTIILGNDSITVGTLEGTIYGDVDATSGLGTLTFGNDTINVSTLRTGGAIYGDKGSAVDDVATGGHDVINVTLMEGGTVNGGVGDDVINVSSMKSGTVSGDEGDDVINVTSMESGTVSGGSGNNTITIGSLQGGTVDGSIGNNTIIINGSMSGGSIDGSLDEDTITINGSMSGGSINTGDGGDRIIINGLMSGGTVDGGLASDTVTVNGTMSGGQINAEFVNLGTLNNGTVLADAWSSTVTITSAMNGGTVTMSSTNGDNLYIGSSSVAGSLTGGTINGSTIHTSIELFGNMSGGSIISNATSLPDDIRIIGEIGGGSITANGRGISLSAGSMSDGTILGSNAVASGTNNDSITIKGLMSGGSIDGRDGNDSITIGYEGSVTMSGGTIYGGGNNDTITLTGLMSGGTIDGGTGLDIIDIYGTMSGGSIVGGAGGDSLSVNGTMSGGSIVGGDGMDSISVSDISGNVTFDLGDDSVGDNLTVLSVFTSGTVNLQHFNTDDTVRLTTRGSSGIYSQSGDIFSIYYADGRVVHIEGDVVGADASTTYATLTGTPGQFDGLDSLTVEGSALTAATFATWAAGSGSTPAYSGSIVVTGTPTLGSHALNGLSFTSLSGGSYTTGNNFLIVNGDLGNSKLLGDCGTILSIGGATGTLTMGNDSISVTGVMSAGGVYGDVQILNISNNMTGSFGNDSIFVGTMTGGAIYGDVADLTGGTGLTTGGNDTITVTNMRGGAIDGNMGNDEIYITTMSAGSVTGGQGIDKIFVNTMTGGALYGSEGADNITVQHLSGNVTIDFGNDTDADRFSIDSSFGGGVLTLENFKAGTGADTASLALGSVDDGNAVRGTASLDGTTLTVTYENGCTVNFTGVNVTGDALQIFNSLSTNNSLTNFGVVS